ncbi:MAG: hypothetical protein H0V79_06640 [Actinobacteria bacterium]|nr:hypothetical protein [Actinomycetota bacterium]
MDEVDALLERLEAPFRGSTDQLRGEPAQSAAVTIPDTGSFEWVSHSFG